MSKWITDRLPEYNGTFVVTIHIVYFDEKWKIINKLDLIDVADYDNGIFTPCLEPFNDEYKGFTSQLNGKLANMNCLAKVNISAWQEVKPYEQMDKMQ